MGFGVPLEKWLRSDLKDWAESLIINTNLQNEGFLTHMLLEMNGIYM